MPILTPHELATLMVVHHAPDQIDMARTELDTLMQYRLIVLAPPTGDARGPVLTEAGRALLNIIAWPQSNRLQPHAGPREAYRRDSLSFRLDTAV